MAHSPVALESGREGSPPSLRLETLAGDRKGTFSIRINRQWKLERVAAEDEGDGTRDCPGGSDVSTRSVGTRIQGERSVDAEEHSGVL